MSQETIILNVNTAEDQNDGGDFEGLALRDAILIANADPENHYQINLPAGTYNLTIQNTLQPTTDSSADGATLFQSRLGTGDLDITGNVTIIGEDPNNTIINAGGDPNTGNDGQNPFPTPGDDNDNSTNEILGDRVFDVIQADSPAGNENAGFLALQNVTIRGGLSSAENIDTVAQGGGLNIEVGAQAILFNSIVRDNNSSDNAGGIYNQGTLTVYGSSILDNLADAAAPEIIEGGGGGILNENTGLLTVINSTISGNRSASNSSQDANGVPDGPGDGGGGILSRGATRIINSTIINNFAQIGSGIYSETNNANTIVYNTIVADNNGSPDVDGFFATASGYNLITNGNGAILDGVNGNIVGGETTPLEDTFIGPLADNGGLTPTHRLLAGSPAIDAGNLTIEETGRSILYYFTDIPELQPFLGDVPLDQRGSERISNGTIDIGAFEVFVENPTIDNAPQNTADDDTAVGVNTPTTDNDTTPEATPTTTDNTVDGDDAGDLNGNENTSDMGINQPPVNVSDDDNSEIIDIPDAQDILNNEVTSDDELVLDTPVFRFQNSLENTYLYVTNSEAENIRDNFPVFEEEGFAFNVATETEDDLIAIFRLQNNNVPGTYLYATREEKNDVLNSYDNFQNEGVAFYVYGADAEQGEDIFRFQSINNPGTYLFVKEAEKNIILSNSADQFTLEGVAFEVG